MSCEPEIQHVEKATRDEMERSTPLTHTQSLGAMTISPEMFEKVGRVSRTVCGFRLLTVVI
jgi:hypothetical protein